MITMFMTFEGNYAAYMYVGYLFIGFMSQSLKKPEGV